MNAPLSMLELRRVEAGILKEVYDIAHERHGKEEAEAIISKAIANSAIAQGKSIRKDGDALPDLEDFADLIPLWERDGALEVDILHRAPEKLDFNISKCRFAEMYAEMGLQDIGHLLSCNRDAALCVGFNPNIELTRTQTIMQGKSHCDFRFRMKCEQE